MTSWQSPSVPSYLDIDAVTEATYALFYNNAPWVTSNMRDGIEYTITGDSSYWWDSVIYAGIQDDHFGKGPGGYYHWWTEGLPTAWNRTIETLKQSKDDPLPDWINDIINRYT